MVKDAISLLAAADTLLTTKSIHFVTIPPELVSFFPSKAVFGSRCTTKSVGTLTFVLNSVQDLGLPAQLDFDVTFTGTLVQPSTSSVPASIRFDVNQLVQTNYTLPGGPSVLVINVTGNIVSNAMPLLQSFWGKSCLGQARIFDAGFFDERLAISVLREVDLTVVLQVNGQPRTLTLNVILSAQFGVAELVTFPKVSFRMPAEAMWWDIFLFNHPSLGPPPPPPFGDALQDSLLGLASVQLAWANHTKADRQHLQRAALSTVESALKRMRDIIDDGS